ncbi:helix-turn-helix domain-containing protein [Gracilibacillus lacisalsi]|uniref:helix-turn-helix domain-containing protein n=1 Tax=Gracilibacillus lacisalsi TaxID=393087 RepID=UPI000368A2C7|nr:helix-turn-helix transcriptional regulator [Gracilibacillus lacisalsi]
MKRVIVLNDLANCIKSKGLTQAEFASMIGTDQSTVSKLCKQKRYTLERLQQLLEALNESDVSKIIRVVEIKD